MNQIVCNHEQKEARSETGVLYTNSTPTTNFVLHNVKLLDAIHKQDYYNENLHKIM